jgi:hypothetical protein
MGGERLEQRPPARREFGEPDDLHRAKDRWRMGEALSRGGGDVERPQHAGRKLVEDGRLQARDGGEARMVIGRACGKVDARAPGFVQRVSRRIDHAGQRFDALQFAHRRRGRAAWMAARRLSSSMGRTKPPASRTAACSKDMIWRP